MLHAIDLLRVGQLSQCCPCRARTAPVSVQAGSRAAVAEARAWQHNAAAWSERLAAAFPLYADLTQPLALAALEASAGLGLLADAAEGLASGSGAREGGIAIEAVVARLLAFPPMVQGAAGAASAVPISCILIK